MANFESLFAAVREPLVLIDARNTVRLMNQAFCAEFGVVNEKAAGLPLTELQNGGWATRPLLALVERVRDADLPVGELEVTLPAGDPGGRTFSVRVTRLRLEDPAGSCILLGFLERADRHDGPDVRQRLEQQLLQSQNMEAIGRLTGGIAHDFNNLLTAIIGYAEMVHRSLVETDPLRGDVEEIMRAATSAASLTRQLLAFSRKQVLQNVVSDSDDVGRSTDAETETILVVEDEQAVRRLTSHLLRRAGYRVLEAAGGRDACAVADGHQGPIHLLLTDLVMPDMSGREAAALLTARRPEMRVIFCSGHAHHTTSAGEADVQAPLLQKPYTVPVLLAKVREVLE